MKHFLDDSQKLLPASQHAMPVPRIVRLKHEPAALKQEEPTRKDSSASESCSGSERRERSSNLTRVEASTSGKVPNLFWRAVDIDDLRAAENFIALPDESSIRLAGAKSFAYVRQGTEVWDALHDGRLTTGILKAALGFNEEKVNKRALGLGSRGHGGHNAILNACHRLSRPKWMEDDVDSALAEAAADFNAAQLELCNAVSTEDMETDDDEDDGMCIDDASTHLTSNASALEILQASLSTKMKTKTKKGKGKKKGKKGGKKSSGKRNRAAGQSSVSMTNMQYCRALARAGEGAIRMAWGSAQEAATCCSMMCHFAGSKVYEAGLCMLDASALPSDWNVGQLPPVGASPDGMIKMPNGEKFVLEVKNSSPFRQMPGSYIVSDRDSYDTPPAYHMPQVQLEMICTGTRSALLAMQSMTFGIRIFRIERDDDFIALMLRRVSRLYTSFVLKGREPPMNWEVNSPEHRAMIGAAIRIAQGATIYDHIPTGLVPSDGSIQVDEAAFIA